MTTTRKLLILAAALLLSAVPSFGQVIRLNKQATLEPRQDVRLGDIATVTGTDPRTAEELSGMVILTSIDSSRTLKAESVLLALMSQRGAQGIGNNLQLGGASQCTLTLADHKTAASPIKVTPPEVPAKVVTAAAMPENAAAKPAANTDTLTLGKLIVARVQQEIAAPIDDVRVTIESVSPLLDAPVPAGRKWLCRPLTRSFLGTVQFEAQLVEGTRVIEKLNVQTKVLRRQSVVVAMTRIDRANVITAGMVRTEDAWVDRSLPRLFTAEKEVIALEAQRAIEIGSMLDQRDFKPALAAAKGDAITVTYRTGSLSVQFRARALTDAKLNDPLEVRNEMTGERYMVRITGKGAAVIGPTPVDAEEKQTSETR